MKQEKAIQRENFLQVDILKLSGFLAAKFHILKPRWLPTPAIPDRVATWSNQSGPAHAASGIVGIFEALKQFCVWAIKAPKSALRPAFSVSTAGSAFTLLEAAQIALTDHGLRFDLDQVVADQPTDLKHRIGRADGSKASAVRA